MAYLRLDDRADEQQNVVHIHADSACTDRRSLSMLRRGTASVCGLAHRCETIDKMLEMMINRLFSPASIAAEVDFPFLLQEQSAISCAVIYSSRVVPPSKHIFALPEVRYLDSRKQVACAVVMTLIIH
ncbi:hypothetical protein MRB53_037432 [Persea americana]|nr:hypothetical protein MRB53_037432 [Persea americana]